MRVPPVASVCPPNEYESFESQQVASDCMWSDPAKDEQVREHRLKSLFDCLYPARCRKVVIVCRD